MKLFHLAASAALMLQVGIFVNANPLFGENGDNDSTNDNCEGFRITFPATPGLSFAENSEHLVAWQAPASLGKVTVALVDSNGQTVDSIGTYDGSQGTTNEVPLHLNGKQTGDYHFQLSTDGSPDCQLDSVSFHISAGASATTAGQTPDHLNGELDALSSQTDQGKVKHWDSGGSSHFTNEYHNEEKTGSKEWSSGTPKKAAQSDTLPDKHWNSGGSSYFTDEVHRDETKDDGWVSETSTTETPEKKPPGKHWDSGGSSYFTDEIHRDETKDDGWVSETSTTETPEKKPPGKHWDSDGSSYFTDEHHKDQSGDDSSNGWIRQDDTEWSMEKNSSEEPKSWSSKHRNTEPEDDDENEWSMNKTDDDDIPAHKDEGEWSMSKIDDDDEPQTKHGNYAETDSFESDGWHRDSHAMDDDDAGHRDVLPVHWTEESATAEPNHKDDDGFTSEVTDMTEEEKGFYKHLSTNLDTELSSLTSHRDATDGWQEEDESLNGSFAEDPDEHWRHPNTDGWQEEDESLNGSFAEDPDEHWRHPNTDGWQEEDESSNDSFAEDPDEHWRHPNTAEWQSGKPSDTGSHPAAGGWETSVENKIPGKTSSGRHGNGGWVDGSNPAENNHKLSSSTGTDSSYTDSGTSKKHENFVFDW